MINSLVLDYEKETFIVLGSSVTSFDMRSAPGGMVTHDLDAYLDIYLSSSDALQRAVEGEGFSTRFIRLDREGRTAYFSTSAQVRIEPLSEQHFFKLPKAAKRGCQPWIRGVVKWQDEEAEQTEVDEAQTLAVWIDLVELALAVDFDFAQ